MVNDLKGSGFLEISHTADWSIKVWAPDLAGLMEASGCGMYALMECQVQPEPVIERYIMLQSGDAETMLVAFLNELLYYLEQEKIGFTIFDIQIDQKRLTAQLSGGVVNRQRKEIKAVTYHNLSIQQVQGRLETTIVFDV
jgi:SHS2 domain-containing protein